MTVESTVRVFNQFYNLDLVVNASEYEIVYSFFRQYFNNQETTKSFTESLFRVSSETDIPVLELLQTFQGSDRLKINATMAYYLNSLSSKTLMYGVSNLLSPNILVQRNILQ
jgi:hypothetical protein